MPFDSRAVALAAGLKGNANRTPEQASAIARAAAMARWAGHEKTRVRPPMLSGTELDYWVTRIPAHLRGTLSRHQIVRRATLMARQAAAQTVAGPNTAPTDDAFALLRAELERKAGER